MRSFLFPFLLAFSLFLGQSAHAANFYVTSDANSGGTCVAESVASANACTLRGAITAANNSAGKDFILFTDAVLFNGGTISVPNGDLPAITSSLNLLGIAGLTIQNGSATGGNVLRVTGGTVSLEDLNLQTSGSGTGAPTTSAIAVQGGDVELRSNTMRGTGNTLGVNFSGGTVSVKDCTFTGNGAGIGFRGSNGTAAVSAAP